MLVCVLLPDADDPVPTRRLFAVAPLVERQGEVAFLDVRGTSRLHGGAAGLFAAILRALAPVRPRGMALASNRFTAEMAARHGRGPVTVAPGDEALYLSRLPLEVLPLTPELARRLQPLGLETLGDFASLPAEAVERRYGQRGLVLHRLARGEDEAGLLPEADEAPLSVMRDVPGGADGLQRLAPCLQEALEQLVAGLVERGLGVVRLALDLTLDDVVGDGAADEAWRPAEAVTGGSGPTVSSAGGGVGAGASEPTEEGPPQGGPATGAGGVSGPPGVEEPAGGAGERAGGVDAAAPETPVAPETPAAPEHREELHEGPAARGAREPWEVLPAAPETRAGLLLDLLSQQLARRPPPRAVTELSLTVLEAAPQAVHQNDLFGEVARDAARATEALSRLAGQLGPAALARPQLQPAHRTEERWVRQATDPETRPSPLSEKSRIYLRSPGSPSTASPGDLVSRVGDRALRWLPVPRELVPILVGGRLTGFREGRRELPLVRLSPPRRLEGGWWRRQPWARDEYELETAEGARYRVCRDMTSRRWLLLAEWD